MRTQSWLLLNLADQELAWNGWATRKGIGTPSGAETWPSPVSTARAPRSRCGYRLPSQSLWR